MCFFGDLCRFSHDLSLLKTIDVTGSTTPTIPTELDEPIAMPSTSQPRPGAEVFIPKYCRHNPDQMDPLDDSNANVPPSGKFNRIWADLSVGKNINNIKTVWSNCPDLCAFQLKRPYGVMCGSYQLCEMCNRFCLHPTNVQQRRKHIQECLQRHERNMELSFAVARSKDKTCGICFDAIMMKPGREKRFGILPNCNHVFCLTCIRKWRQAKQFKHKITRACPECRVASDFVCPSVFWVETKEEKDKLLRDYRTALARKDCKYFKKGDGKCPFGNKCFYKHALPNGDLVDVGCPQRARKIRRNTDEFFDLLDIYLWEFIDQRDYHWTEVNSISTDNDDSDWCDE